MDLIEEDDDSLLGPQAFPALDLRSTTIVSSRARHSINRLERDRVLFQRQKFGQPSTTQQSQPNVIQSSSQVPHQRRYSQRRRTSSYSRRYVPSSARTLDENYNIEMPPLPSSSESEEEGSDGDQRRQRLSSSSQILQQRPTPPPDDLIAELHEDCGLIPQIDRPMSMPYLCAKMWRWRELQVDAALHRLDPLPWCRFGRVTINNATVSCCNPFHYALWIRPEHSLSSSSAEGEDVGETQPVGILANGGGPFATPMLGKDQTSDTGFADEESMIAGIGHVRATFKSVEAMNATRAAFLAAFNDESDDTPPPVPPPPVPPLQDDSLIKLQGANEQNEFAVTIANAALLPNHLPSVHSQAMAWARMARWERKERIGDVVTIVGEFAAVGKLAGTVYDGQDVKLPWDLENDASFALIKQSEGGSFEDIWLYNSGDRPLFISISKTLGSQRSDTIRRLSPGYCIRVHRSPIGERTINESLANFLSSARRPTVTTFNDPIAAAMMLNSVSFLTISVGVGWGINYQRLHVTDCPARYEVIFT